MAQFLTSPLIVIAALAVTLLAIGVPMYRMIAVYRGTPTRREFDASAAGLQPSEAVAAVVAQLRLLGFSRLGEAQVDLPGFRSVQLTASGNPRVVGQATDRHTIFVMVDAERTVMAETGQVPGVRVLVSLNSIFGDSSVVETMYPRGESIDDPDFHSGHNTLSLEAAYQEQRSHLARWKAAHGSARVISTMNDYLLADATFRERFSRRKLRGPLIRRQLLPAAIAVVVITAIALLLLKDWPSLPG
jgi:hypothetical protein